VALNYTALDDIQQEFIQAGIVKKMMELVTSDEQETQYWVIQVLHDLSKHEVAFEDLTVDGGVQKLCKMATTAKFPVILYIADVLLYLCTNGEIACWRKLIIRENSQGRCG
jgi:hypothetical protein